MPGIGVVLNPKSRSNLRDPSAATKLARLLGSRGEVRSAGSHDELRRIAEDFRARDLDALALAGGDGTGHVTLTAFVHAFQGQPLPPLVLLRGGTMNTVANGLGLTRATPLRLLRRFLELADRHGPRALPRLERNLLRAGDQYGFLFGTGVVCGFLGEYYDAGDGAPTPITAVKTLARGIASAAVQGPMIKRMAAPFHGRVEFPGDPRAPAWVTRDYLAIAAGTVDQIGLGFRPFHRFAEREGALHLVGIHASAMGFVRALPRVHRGLSMKPTTAYEALTSLARVITPRGPLRYMIDGDLHHVEPSPLGSRAGEPDGEASLELAIGPRVSFVTI